MRTWFFFASAATALAITVSCSSSGPPDTFTPSSGGGGASNTASNNGSGGETQSAHASVSAGAGAASASQPPAADVYGSAFSTIQLEIDYEAGAEPYTGNVVAFGPIWDLTERHLEALYSGANKTFIVPRELSDMQNLGDLGKDSYDVDEIFAIVADHRDLAPVSGSTVSYYVLWLDGRYRNAEGVQNTVLGVSFGTSGVITMFKPVIAGAGVDPTGATQRYVEQVTLIHEMGHASGLVNNGLELTSAHQDEEHGAHCNNNDCVMYYAVAGTSGVVEYVQKSVSDPDVILWGQECLDDAAAAVAAGN